MIKIGDFSKLSLVSIRMLRYYEEMGLLAPAQVDAFTGYRYYTVEQLPRLNRILALRDLGLSLEQVAHLLETGLPVQQLRGMLKMKQLEIEQQLDAEQARLARVAARLRQIEQEDSMSPYEVVIKKVEPQTVASLRRTIPTPQEIGKMFGDLFTCLGQQNIRPLGAPGAVWHDSEHKEADWDAEVIVPVQEGLQSAGEVRILELPGAPMMAATVHQGSYEGFAEAYNALLHWIAENGYQLAGPMREFYLRGPSAQPDKDDPSGYVTEIQVPVSKP